MKKCFLLGLIALIAVACKSDDPDPTPTPQPDDEEVVFSSFRFRASSNSALSNDVVCNIEDNEITVLIPSIKSADGLTPSFAGNFAKVEVDGKEQSSGNDPQNFNNVVTYKLTDSKGNTSEYRVTVRTFTGLPIVTIKTNNNQPVLDKENWVNGTVSISKTPDFESGYEGTMRTRGRGNATWISYPKKPYRFKLDTKSEILGMPSDKDWVLLAEYCDKSLLRTTYAHELSKLAGLPWTSRGHHVEFFMNNTAGTIEYMGTYYLCEHVKVAPDRADVSSGGFMIERDNYWNLEPVYFHTNRGIAYTFKFPDSDDISNGDPTVTAIKNYMDEFEAALYGSNFKDASAGYRKYIDPVTFAQWMLVQEVLGNIDTNPYIVRTSSSAKMQMYPVWDFEWSLGLAAIESRWASPPAVSPVDRPYWMNNGFYFARLMEDPYFRNIVKTEWAKFKNDYIPALKEKVKQEADRLQYAQVENFKKWQILDKWEIGVNLVKFATWQEEVDYAADFFQKRVTWLDGRIANL